MIPQICHCVGIQRRRNQSVEETLICQEMGSTDPSITDDQIEKIRYVRTIKYCPAQGQTLITCVNVDETGHCTKENNRATE